MCQRLLQLHDSDRGDAVAFTGFQFLAQAQVLLERTKGGFVLAA